MFEELLKFYKSVLYKLTIGYSLQKTTLKTLICKLSEYLEFGTSNILYGKISYPITQFSQITDLMLTTSHLLECPIGDYELSINVRQGDTVIILVPETYNITVTKGDGFDKELLFNTSVFGCNGEKTISVFNRRYKVYGELMLGTGRLTIYTHGK